MSNVVINPYSFVSGFTNTYSCDFDGVDDYFFVGDIWSSFLGSNYWAPFSLSFWYKGNNPIAGSVHTKSLCSMGHSQWIAFYDAYLGADNVRLYLTFQGSYANWWKVGANGVDIFDNLWHHLMIVFPPGVTNGCDPASSSLYIDGSLAPKGSSGDVAQPIVNYTWDKIEFMEGSWPNLGGLMDEISFWGSDQSANILDIWGSVSTGQGNSEPIDLSGIATPPNNWWRMGDKVISFPTLPDQIGSIDGALNNMVAGDIVTETP